MTEHKYPHELQDLIKELRRVIFETDPSLNEFDKWGNLTYEKNGQICSIVFFQDSLYLEFFQGAKLTDKEGLLEGTGRSLHMKIKKMDSIEADVITGMINESIILNRELHQTDIIWILVLTSYLSFLFLILVSFLCELWLNPVESGIQKVKFLFGFMSLFVTEEVRLILIVAVMGALGSYVHSAAAFITHTGVRDFEPSWVVWYFLLPPISSSMAVVFYFAVRGMFFSFSSGTQDMNIFGVAALGGIVGMFTKEATVKLRDVFKEIFNVTDESPWKETKKEEKKQDS